MSREKILELLKDSRIQRIILGIIIILLLWWGYLKIQSYRSQLAYNDQNQKALLTQLKMWKGKSKNNYSSNYSLLSIQNDSLKRYSEKLYYAFERFKKENTGADPGVIINAEFSISSLENARTNTFLKYDTTSGRGAFLWSYSLKNENFSRDLSGVTSFTAIKGPSLLTISPDSTMITRDRIEAGINLFQVINDDNSISVVAESLTPYLRIKEVKSVVYPKTIKEYVNSIETPTSYSVSLGVSGGLGVNPMNISNGVVVQPYVGIGININFLHLFNF